MSSKYKIGIFKDKVDIEFVFTNDNIVNITGMMGSGKTTLAKQLANDTKYELIILDWMFGYSLGNRTQKINDLLKKLEKNYPETEGQKIFRNKTSDKKIIEQKYYEYADIIYDFLLENIKAPMIMEGQHIYKWMNKKILKGKLIIKRTSLINAYKRAFKRDVTRLYKKYKNGEASITDVFDKIFERIKAPINDYIKINKYITSLIKDKQIECIKYLR